MRKFLLLQTLIILSFLFFANFALAENPPPECTDGDCCSDDGHFLSSDIACDAQTETECYWGTGCGQDVGERAVIQYCSGNSSSCNGQIEHTEWSPPERGKLGDCQPWEVCSPATSLCEYSSTCPLPEAPILISPANNTYTKIPVDLSWEYPQGAAAYYHYEVSRSPDFSSIIVSDTEQTSRTIIDYPILETGNDYWWRVKVCVDGEEEVYGNWSERSFHTYPLNPSANPQPLTGFLPITLTWTPDPGSNFYQYKVAYSRKSPEELSSVCAGKEGQQIIPAAGREPPITNQASFSLNEFCLGEYQWRVRSCLNNDCSVASDWAGSPVWIFNSLKPTASQEKGIVPCGRKDDNADTLYYDEREPCQIKHLGFMLQNILDFLLWRLGLIVMVILTVISGVVSYFSLGSPNALVQIKSIWKSAGIGWSIILLAWIFINLIMTLIGFQVQFFGHWWQLSF